MDLHGFIGEVYRQFPFSDGPRRFQTKPEGFPDPFAPGTILTDYGQAEEIPVRFRRKENEVAIGEYRFDQENFQELIFYMGKAAIPNGVTDANPDMWKP